MGFLKNLVVGFALGAALVGCGSSSIADQDPQGITEPSEPSGTIESAEQSESLELSKFPEDAAQADHSGLMDLGPKDGEFDLRFLDGMILHHQGAIEMAQLALQESSRPEIQQLSQGIITAQQGEITQMQQWREAWYPRASSDPVMYHAEMGHSMTMTPEMQATMMMSEDLGRADEAFDQRFLEGMIVHHEGALDMAQQVLQNSDRPELQQLAQAILTTQQAEIDQMQQWNQSWYPAPSNSP